jgi:hypothetical protein
MIMVLVVLSAVAGVTNEFLMKKVPGNQSIHVQVSTCCGKKQ